MSDNQPFPVKRAILAIFVGIVCALMLMPILTFLPFLDLVGGPLGPAFALFIAPLVGLFFGPFIAPLSTLLAVIAFSAMVIGLTRMGRTTTTLWRAWVWALFGLISGTAAGATLSYEFLWLGVTLPIMINGGLTGVFSALIAHRIMRL